MPCSLRSTPSSARWRWPRAGRCACWPARAPARPGRSRTGSPTRARDRRRRPGQVLAVTFTTRAAGELRGRLRQLGRVVPGAGLEQVQARTFHAAALRQLTHFWPGTVGGPAPRCWSPRSACSPRRPGGCGCRAGLPELRDAAAEIEWAKVTQVRPGRLRRRPARRPGRTPPSRREQLARLFAALRGAAPRAAPGRLRVGARADRRPSWPSTRPPRAAVRDRYRYFVVDEYQDVNPLQKLLLDAWAGRPGRRLRGRRPAADDLLVHRRHPGLPDRLRGRVPRTPRWSGWCATTGPRRRWWRWRTGCARPGAASTAWAAPRWPRSGRPARGRSSPSTRTSRPRRPRWPAGAPTLIASGTAGQPRSRCWSAPTRRPQAYEQALAAAGVPFQVRGAERFFERAEVRQAVGLLRAAAAVGVARTTTPAGAGPAGAGRARPDPRAAGGPGHGPGALGVAGGAGPARRRLLRRAPGRQRWPTWPAELAVRSAIGHAPAMDGVTLGLAARGQGPGVGRGVPARADRGQRCRSSTPRPTRRSRRSGGCCTSGSPGPGSGCTCRGRWPGRRAAAPTRKPSRFLDGLRPDAAGARCGSGGAGARDPDAR